MRVYISVDIEGINGVCHSSQTQPGEPGYERSVTLMHQEVNAVIKGARKAGASEIVVNDAHYDMRNLRVELLEPGVKLISGWQKPYSMMAGISGVAVGAKNPFDAALFVGYHCRAGKALAVLSHTYRPQVFREVKLNGAPVGETGLNAALAGYYQVPIALITGDDAVCQEAKDLLGSVASVAVKQAVSRYSAVFLPEAEVLSALEKTTNKALVDKANHCLFSPPSPSTIELTMVDPAMADAGELLPDVKRIDDCRLQINHADYTVLFKLMLALGVIGASRRDPYFD